MSPQKQRITPPADDLTTVGFANMLRVERVRAVLSPRSMEARGLIEEGRRQGTLIDMTNGRRVNTAAVMDSGHVVLAAGPVPRPSYRRADAGLTMPTDLVHIGFGNVLAANRVLAIVSPRSAPVKTMIKDGKSRGLIVDMTSGRRVRAAVVLDSGHIVLAALTPATIANRLQNGPGAEAS